LKNGWVVQFAGSLAAGVEVPSPSQGNQFFGNRADTFGPSFGSFDTFVSK
jgi:hypothetical protein